MMMVVVNTMMMMMIVVVVVVVMIMTGCEKFGGGKIRSDKPLCKFNHQTRRLFLRKTDVSPSAKKSIMYIIVTMTIFTKM